jgi:Protein of unknown function (DUF3006)
MTGDTRLYVVDRLESDLAVLIADDDSQVELPKTALPFRLSEGMVLRVSLDTHGAPEWRRAERDEAEERRRMDDARARLERLKRRDPGGDIRL